MKCAATLVLSLSLAFLVRSSAAQDDEILAAVILPANNARFHITLSRVVPLLQMAARRVIDERILNGLRFRFMARNGNCDGQLAQINAVEAFYNEHVNVFFGPTCEYSCAPIARMIKFWNTPLLTTGAFTHDFTKNKTDPNIENSGEYKLLTRVSPMAFEDLSRGMIQFFQRNSWNRVMLFYDKNGYEVLSGDQTCYLMVQTLVTGLKRANIHYGAFDTEKNKYSLKHNLKVEVGAGFGKLREAG